MTENPVLFVGIDVAHKRDTAALVAVARDREADRIWRYGHVIWKPPVFIPDITACALHILNTRRVGAILYDPAQFVGEAQRLIDAGFEHVLHAINQQSMMVEVASTLHNHIQRHDFVCYKDAEFRGQYSWTNAVATERGYRIVKMKQSRPIDAVVAEAMALWGANQDFAHMSTPAYSDSQHAIPLTDLA